MSSPPNFYAEELDHALREHSFGLHDYTIHDATVLQCSATVTLLEGRKIQITLRNMGYSVESAHQQTIYETIEELLTSASPLFKQKRHELLIKALEKLENIDYSVAYAATEDD